MNEKVDYVHKLERVCQLNRPEPPDNRGYQPPLGSIHLSSDYWLSNRPNLSMVSIAAGRYDLGARHPCRRLQIEDPCEREEGLARNKGLNYRVMNQTL